MNATVAAVVVVVGVVVVADAVMMMMMGWRAVTMVLLFVCRRRWRRCSGPNQNFILRIIVAHNDAHNREIFNCFFFLFFCFC